MPDPTPGSDKPGDQKPPEGGGDASQKSGGITAEDLQKGLDGIAGRTKAVLADAMKPIMQEVTTLKETVAALQAGGQKGGDGDKGGDKGGKPTNVTETPEFKAAVDAAVKPLRERMEQQDRERAADRQKLALSRLSKAAADRGALDGDLVAREVAGRIKVGDDGTVQVMDEAGQPAYDDKGQPLSVDALVVQYLKGHQFLVKAEARPGLDFGKGHADTGTGDGKPKNRKEELKAKIAELEASGKPEDMAQVGALKTELLQLARPQ